MCWLSRRRKDKVAPERRQPRLEEVSAAAQNALTTVGAAVRRCETATGDDLADARRELTEAVRESTAALENVVRDVPPKSPRLHRMARLTAEELATLAQPWLTPDPPGHSG
jgi:phage-related minor tail protein